MARSAARLIVRNGRSWEPSASSDPVVATWNSDGMCCRPFASLRSLRRGCRQAESGGTQKSPGFPLSGHALTPVSSSKGSAGAQQVFDGKPLQAGESVALSAGSVDVEVFERAAVL